MRKYPMGGLARWLRAVSVVVSLPLIYMLAYLSLPYVGGALSGAAQLSVELNFPGGIAPPAEAAAPAREPFADNSDSPAASEAAKPPAAPEADSAPQSAPQSAPEVTVSGAASQPDPNAAGTPAQLAPLVLPTKPTGAGVIRRQTYLPGTGSIYIPLEPGSIKNCTEIGRETILKAVADSPEISVKSSDKPLVLIMHTHATESYQAAPADWYDKEYSCRTTDTAKNMCRVGDEIQKQLEAAGIGVLHDKTLHDYPSYNGAYGRSAATVKKLLKQYPSIQVVLDVHRDAIQPDGNTMVAPVTTINGRSCAQVMVISGCDDGTMNMPGYLENLKLSAALVRTMERDYPTLSRPILFDYRKYNQDLTSGSILLEMGGHANTLDEAIYCGELVGKALAKTLLS